MNFAGYRVVPSTMVPRWRWTGPVVLGPIDVSPAFRYEFNEWARELFGGSRKSEIYVSEVDRTIYVHPDVLPELKRL